VGGVTAIVVCDNDLGLPEGNSPTSYVLVLLMAIAVVFLVLPRGASMPPFISKGGEVTRKVTELVTT
jgi:hypothetical protein